MVQKLPPRWLIGVINSFRTLLIKLNRTLFPGNIVLYEQFQNFWLLPSLYVAARLDIASILERKPLTAAGLSEILHADPLNVSRIMRALASQGIFKETRDGRYTLNSQARALLDGPGSIRHVLLHHLGPVNWKLMSNLEYAVLTGKDAFTGMYGERTYEYLKSHPDENLLFDRSMTNLSDLGLAPILKGYDFSEFPVITDIGGGEGFLLSNILHHNPVCRGILFDIPDALEKAPELAARYQVENRLEIMSGDFFQSIPAGGDLYILKNIIHNWGDELSVNVLKKIHDVIQPKGRLLIIEMLVPPGNGPSLSKLLDIQMMATMQGGKERTQKEYGALLASAGFAITAIIPTIAPLSLIEARKID